MYVVFYACIFFIIVYTNVQCTFSSVSIVTCTCIHVTQCNGTCDQPAIVLTTQVCTCTSTYVCTRT